MPDYRPLEYPAPLQLLRGQPRAVEPGDRRPLLDRPQGALQFRFLVFTGADHPTFGLEAVPAPRDPLEGPLRRAPERDDPVIPTADPALFPPGEDQIPRPGQSPSDRKQPAHGPHHFPSVNHSSLPDA